MTSRHGPKPDKARSEPAAQPVLEFQDMRLPWIALVGSDQVMCLPEFLGRTDNTDFLARPDRLLGKPLQNNSITKPCCDHFNGGG